MEIFLSVSHICFILSKVFKICPSFLLTASFQQLTLIFKCNFRPCVRRWRWIFVSFFLSCQQTRQTCRFGLYAISTSKVYLYITTVQSGSLACKIGVLHIYIRYTIIYYHNKTQANKKKQENNLLNTLSFLQFSQHFYKTRKTDSQYYYYYHYYY